MSLQDTWQYPTMQLCTYYYGRILVLINDVITAGNAGGHQRLLVRPKAVHAAKEKPVYDRYQVPPSSAIARTVFLLVLLFVLFFFFFFQPL